MNYGFRVSTKGWPVHSSMAMKARDALGTERMTALADRGYFNAPEILACEQAGVIPLVPKPLTSSSKAEGLNRPGNPGDSLV